MLKLFKITIINTLCISSLSVFANTELQIETELKKEVKSLNSRSNRKNLSFSMLIGTMIKTDSSSPVKFYELAYFISPQLLISFKHSKYENGYSLDLIGRRQFELTGKIFSGNSFYTKLGGFYRKGTVQYDVFTTSSYGYRIFSGEVRTEEYGEYGVTLSIGNQWQWKYR